jgi:hypothetical protein
LTVARTPRRRGRSVDELSVRWGLSTETTLEFLEAFRRAGYARGRGELWYATAKAARIVGFGPDS